MTKPRYSRKKSRALFNYIRNLSSPFLFRHIRNIVHEFVWASSDKLHRISTVDELLQLLEASISVCARLLFTQRSFVLSYSRINESDRTNAREVRNEGLP